MALARRSAYLMLTQALAGSVHIGIMYGVWSGGILPRGPRYPRVVVLKLICDLGWRRIKQCPRRPTGLPSTKASCCSGLGGLATDDRDDARGIAVGETPTAPGSATPSTRTTSHRPPLGRVSVDNNGVGQGGWTTNDGFATVLSLTGVRVLTGPGNVHWSTIAKQIWISICVRVSRSRVFPYFRQVVLITVYTSLGPTTSATSHCHAFAGPWVTAVGRMTDLPEVPATSESSNHFQCLQLHVILRDPATVVFALI
ncbi:hypothetical protein EDB86DRAFT_2828831 [Lactarius hatsudake]|nr:hypothetical protein EDB86DRAFT_2828831 [Lactarius hatsudake]